MNTIYSIEDNFESLYLPKSALVFYENNGIDKDVYIEHFDMDHKGNPINAHPLTVKEATKLVKALRVEKEEAFLKPKGVLPTNVLHINPNKDSGTIIWYSKKQQRQLYFVDELEIPKGKANLPPMLWKANKNSLSVFALINDRRPTEKTNLCFAPFLNIYKNGNVCMGTVSIDIEKSESIEEFILIWENYFFNSYFSHLIDNHSPINGNCTSLWKDLIDSDKPFPLDVLKKNNKTLKTLL